MKKDDSVYLRHILDAINTIEEYLHGVDETKLGTPAYFKMEQFDR
jgi:uncharacterized protein with HEPN domain